MMALFEAFGEMSSHEEINELAMNLANEGDRESLVKMLKENGLDTGLADGYMAGEIDYICDALDAALGKLAVEREELKLPKDTLISDWISYIEGLCMEDEAVAMAVRAKGKYLASCLAEILKESFRNQWTVPQPVMKAAGVSASRVTFGVPGTGKVRKIIKAYYLGGKA